MAVGEEMVCPVHMIGIDITIPQSDVGTETAFRIDVIRITVSGGRVVAARRESEIRNQQGPGNGLGAAVELAVNGTVGDVGRVVVLPCAVRP